MRVWWLSTLVILTLAATGRTEAPRWFTDYEEAKTLAQRQGKPLFVVFRCEH